SREWSEKTGNDWEPYWKDDSSKLVHFIGKDNIVFHCIIFPSMLKAEGSYIVPENVPANEFLNLENDKISTSRNWAVWLHEYLVDFPDKQDVLRYVLTANAPETKDNDFTWKDFQTKNNSELVAIFGNFVNRALVLTQKYFDGVVPAVHELTELDQNTLNEMLSFADRVGEKIQKYKFREAINEFMNLARLGNKYLTETEPWKVFKTDPERVETILHISLQISATLAVLSEPFIPFTSAKLKGMLNMGETNWEMAKRKDLVKTGDQLPKPNLLFTKIEDKEVAAQVQKLLDTKKANEAAEKVAAPAKENIQFEDFAKMDIRVGTIIEAEKVAKTKKLLKLVVDTGIDKRTVVSGIAEYYKPEDIIGKQVSVLVNLAPKKLRGIESQGMILMAEDNDGTLRFVAPTDVVKNGSEVK
ncbi:MAG: methionine--tRNA ligase subunit beta, partial [Bacteroidales bacterium]|nr:methionine--tRNA ligase subunit beta [Bacteroidales bacterium]